MNGAREKWTSKVGFVLAAAGSAVGLGNIWRFSYVTGTNGGAAFVIIYLVAIVLIGYPMMVTEVAIGRKSEKNPVGAFKALAPNTPWWLVGALGVFSGFVILSFYSVVAGWSVAYIFKAIAGFIPDTDFAGVFVEHITSTGAPIIWHAIFMVLTAGIIAAGVVKGIQRWVKILMPVLFILLIILVLRALTLPGAGEGIAFYLAPRFGDVTAGTLLAAIGQAFFTLSLGMGAMITYGSYLSNQENIADNGGWVVGLDTAIAIVAGFAIFPAVFAFGFDPAAGPGLVFITLPAVFAEMPAGSLFGFIFFVLLSVAALTSAISLLEVVVAWLVDEKDWPRVKAAVSMGIVIFVIGLPTTLGFGVWGDVRIIGMEILDFYDFLASELALPIGGALTAIFAGHVWKARTVVDETNSPPGAIKIGNWYGVLIKYVIPIAVFLVLLFTLIDFLG